MLFVNKEGSCYRTAHTNLQIELLKTRGFVPVEEEKPAKIAEKPAKAEVKRSRAAAKKTENTDGSLEVTI